MGIAGDVLTQTITTILVIFLIIIILVLIVYALVKFGFITWIARKIISGVIGI